MSTRHTDELRAGATLEARMVAARRDGTATAEAGEPRINPWSGTSDSAVERVLSKMWARGYTHGNPVTL